MSSPMHADMKEALANLQAPQTPLPAGAWDCHAHVFGPFDSFPLVEGAPYRPPLAPFEDYIDMLDRVGFAHGVIVHAGANGFDNSGMLDALARANGRLRGIAVIPVDTPDATLQHMHDLGVRGVRFTAVNQMAGASTGVLNLADLERLAPRLRELGWHAQLWAKSDIILENAALLRSLGIAVVLDHMGSFDVSLGVDDKAFQAVLGLVSDGIAWIKTTAFRNSRQYPQIDDVRPFHQALVRSAPGRLLWGSDWPFIGMGDRLPQVADLLAKMREWTSDDAAYRRILVANPAELYAA